MVAEHARTLKAMAEAVAEAQVLLWFLNDAPCPPFPSHGASILCNCGGAY
jgi:hypothetical protein